MTVEPEWTKTDGEAAQREGWGIFHVSGVGDETVRLERLDDAATVGPDVPQLDDDSDAWRIVRNGAKSGGSLHMKALAYVKYYNPAEYNLVTSEY